jgi:amidohydrolase
MVDRARDPDGSSATGRVVRWRRELHARPELGFDEHETAAFVVERLGSLGGFTVRAGVAGTGVVADLPGPRGAPVLALRADMDALPIQETTEVPFRSQVPGRMHACGHDGHVAMLLGAAAVLAGAEARPASGVRLLFQPCEESVGDDGRSGAERMVAEGALDGVASAFALHLEPSLPLGTVRLASGPVMASVDTFSGSILGAGGHGARPERTVDPVSMLTSVLSALNSIVSRRVPPFEQAVVSVGRLSAGTSANVIPARVDVDGTLRSFTPDVRDLLRTEVERAFSVARALGGDYSLEVRAENPPLVNDPGAVALLRRAVGGLWPEAPIIDEPYGMLSEDFAFVAQVVPAAMAMLGCAPSRPRELHSPDFDIDERVLGRGVDLLCEAVRLGGRDG